MYIDIYLGVTLLILSFAVLVIAVLIAAVGWTSYIGELAKNEVLYEENDRLRRRLRGSGKNG